MKNILLVSVALIWSLIFTAKIYAQAPVIIKGRIFDNKTKEALIAVNVVEIDKNGRFISGTITDENGNFMLKVSNGDAIIQVSFIGYVKHNLKLNNQAQINVFLEQESQDIGEVVIEGAKIGYNGYTNTRDKAVATSKIEFTELKTIMATTVEEMLQGRLGNVDITTVSGDPGAGLNIRIRGTATLNARNSPLIVINGIPYDTQIDEAFDFGSADVEKFGNLIDVSPEDIESIEVLKDAASTAIWGSKAANGVLMIRTKRGIKSKPIFEYTYKIIRAKEPPSLPMLDGAGYARLITEEHYNYDRNEFFDRTIAFDPEWEEYYNYSQNTDWVKEITQVAYTNQHDFSVRGGGEKSRYNMSLGYFDESGTTIGNRLKKLNLRTSLDYDLSSKLQFKTDVMFTRYDQNSNYDVEDYEFNFNKSLRAIAYRKMPNMSVYERDTNNVAFGDYFTPLTTLQGTARDIYNPVAFAKLGVHNRIKDNARALFNLKYQALDNLIINSTVTLDIFDNKIEKFLPFKAIGYDYYNDITNRAYNDFTKKSSIYTFNQVIYSPTMPKNHELTIMGQFDTEESIQRGYNVQTSQSASPDLQQPIGDKHLVYFNSAYSKFRSMGLFLDIHYKLKDKYIFSFGTKYEGNSRFSKESRWGFFPAVTAAWRVSGEDFMKAYEFVNDFRIRGSWGQTGNSPDENYLYFNTYEAGSGLAYLDMQGVRPQGMELTSLKWETVDQSNLGFSFIGLNNRLNIEFDIYRKKTLNLYLKDMNIPDQAGFSNINKNDGELENQGWELSGSYQIINQPELKFSLDFNTSQNKNIVIRLPENYTLEYGNMLSNGEYKISIKPGNAMGGFFGYRYLGVYANDADAVVKDEQGNPVYGLNKDTPLNMIHGGSSAYVYEGGDAQYDDRNHDGKIDELDLVYLGDLNPKIMGGIGPRIQYKNIVFNMFFYYKLGQKIINQTRMDTEKMYNHDNQSLATDWRWRRPGDQTNVPRALYQRGFNWLGSDRFVEDGSYLRIKTASFSYYFDKSICNRLKVKDLKLFLTAYNLYTWSKYSGQDPDVGPPSKPDQLPKDYSKTPPSRRYMLGVNFTF